MGRVASDWFDPRRLFDAGYPAGITSALRALPAVRTTVQDAIRSTGARSILEIGPGDAPVTDGMVAVHMDVAAGFFAGKPGMRVVGDLFSAPFAPGTFELVVASDVLTHVRPARRREALARIVELGHDVVIFNPEPGTAEVADSPVPTRLVTAYLDDLGYRVESRKFVAMTPGGEYRMRLVIGHRPS